LEDYLAPHAYSIDWLDESCPLLAALKVTMDVSVARDEGLDGVELGIGDVCQEIVTSSLGIPRDI
jgi:hypothetical protein